MRPYFQDYDDAISTFPEEVYQPFDFRNAKRSGYADRTETGTVPGVENSYTVELDERIQLNGTLTIEANGTPLTIVPYGYAPGANDAAVSYDLPLVQVHSSRAGQTLEVIYTPLGGAISAQVIHGLQAEIVAIQEHILEKQEVRSLFLPGIPQTGNLILSSTLVLDNGTGERRIKRINVFARDRNALNTSGSTIIYVTTAATATGGDSATLPGNGAGVAAYRVTEACDIAIDTSGGPVWVNVFCTDKTGNHQDLTVEVFIE